jgi:hypothetical protein
MTNSVPVLDRSRRWTCHRCEVSVGQIDGKPIELPDWWTSSDEGEFCLKCCRERAADAALESMPEAPNREAKRKLRQTALLEFELNRAPDRPNGKIAGTCNSSVRAVAESRERLGLGEAPSSRASSATKTSGK